VSRFVILRHDPMPGGTLPLHWDLMIEHDETLWTWALAEQPQAGASISGELLADHRKAYLEYEGPLSRDRGSVARWDAGEFQWVKQSQTVLVVRLIGQRFKGTVQLEQRQPEVSGPRTDGRGRVAGQRWTVSFSSEVRGAR